MTARNDITGDAITNSKGNQKKYSDGWDRIFGKKVAEAYQELEDKQESLGEQFEESLANNLDKLYNDKE